MRRSMTKLEQLYQPFDVAQRAAPELHVSLWIGTERKALGFDARLDTADFDYGCIAQYLRVPIAIY